MPEREFPDPGVDTRGMTQRELILELRGDIKELREEIGQIKDKLGGFPERKEVYGVMVSAITLGLLFFNAIVGV
jgi:hypothetical protein